MSDESPATAVVSAVKLAVPGYDVRDTQVKGTPNRNGYIVVYCDEGRSVRASVAGSPTIKHVTVQVSSFAPDRPGAGYWLAVVRNYLLANGVTVPGWGHGELEHDETRRPAWDADVPEFPVVLALDLFSMDLSKE